MSKSQPSSSSPHPHAILLLSRRQAVDRWRRAATKAGFTVNAATNSSEALHAARSGRRVVVVSDLLLPQMTGLDLCRTLSNRANAAVILVLPKDDDAYVEVAIAAGAFATAGLPLEVRAMTDLLVRAWAHAAVAPAALPTSQRVGTIEIDGHARVVRRAGRPIELTAKEFDLLSFLLANHGRICTQEQLVTEVWHGATSGDPTTLYVHIRWLRTKLQADDPIQIVTVPRFGYRLDIRQ